MTPRPRRGWLVLGAAVLALTSAIVVRGRGSPPERHELAIRAFAFEPAALEARAGDTLVWTNHDLVPHTVTAPEAGLESGVIAPGASWSSAAPATAHVQYLCAFHPTMKGTITVH